VDGFTGFLDARARALLDAVVAAMGKQLEMETGTMALEADDTDD